VVFVKIPRHVLAAAVLLIQVGFLTSCKPPSEKPAEEAVMSDASAPVEAPASDSGPPYEISIPEVPVDQW
jgi:hypothetical protein